MNSILLSLNIILPMSLYLLTGFMIRKSSYFNETFRSGMNKVVTDWGLPAMLLFNTYRSDFKTHMNVRLIVFTAVGIAILFGLAILIVPVIVKENKKRAVIVHGIFRGNSSIYGLALAQRLMGDTGEMSELLAAISVAVILFNIFGTITLSVFTDKKKSFLQVVMNILKTPMLIGGFLGLAGNLLAIPLPEVFLSFVSGLGGITTPLAFLCLGASFQFGAWENTKLALVITSVRIIVIPAITLFLCVFFFGFHGNELATLLAIFATPCAVNTYPLAAAYGADDKLAGGILIYTTFFSVFTLFAFILILHHLSLI